jgi:PAS domain S-box-containing protein
LKTLPPERSAPDVSVDDVLITEEQSGSPRATPISPRKTALGNLGRRAHHRLPQPPGRHRRVVDDAIMGKTLHGIVTSRNCGAEGMYGYAADEMGRSIILLVPPERHHGIAAFTDRLARGEVIGDYETIRLKKNGDIVHVSLSFSPILDAPARPSAPRPSGGTSPSESGARRGGSPSTPSRACSPTSTPRRSWGSASCSRRWFSMARMLLVEDDPHCRELLTVVARASGAEVTAVASVQEALRSQGPAVALTGYACEADRETAAAAGFQLHLAKPVEPEELIRTLSRLLAGTSSGGARDA